MLSKYTNDIKVGFVDTSGTYFVKVYENCNFLYAEDMSHRYCYRNSLDQFLGEPIAEVVSMERIPKVSEIS